MALLSKAVIGATLFASIFFSWYYPGSSTLSVSADEIIDLSAGMAQDGEGRVPSFLCILIDCLRE
jgi:hypothetical protein